MKISSKPILNLTHYSGPQTHEFGAEIVTPPTTELRMRPCGVGSHPADRLKLGNNCTFIEFRHELARNFR
ncbi:hypothetical protein [Laspinema olomoucense]|uniref:Uncharacterized protein n=1 Tax=Laspinema olomoucense D3b TaxID=2953688 RepID=A0ABT2NCM3_9CYAN|nr:MULTISPECIES: hypothetical protein [unclassified Laspinema]MCT7974529.1 hypothetical protein [Laspinema sp. D3d]MCT7979634.1 hypothetical protein [Laspinema sp. D3b]